MDLEKIRSELISAISEAKKKRSEAEAALAQKERAYNSRALEMVETYKRDPDTLLYVEMILERVPEKVSRGIQDGKPWAVLHNVWDFSVNYRGQAEIDLLCAGVQELGLQTNLQVKDDHGVLSIGTTL